MAVKEENNVYSMSNDVVKMSAWQPIEINPLVTQNGFNIVCNGTNNSNYKTLRDAYDDSPTNQSIINSFVNFMYANGLKNIGSSLDISRYLDEDTVELICLDVKLFGGFCLQVIWNDSEKDRQILRFEYVPIEEIAVEIDDRMVKPRVVGYWHSEDWKRSGTYRPIACKKFDGTFQGGCELVIVQRVTKNKYYPLPDYFSGINYCIAEGYLGQNTKTHFQFENKITTVINFNGGKQGSGSETVKEERAKKIKEDYTGGSPKHHVVVSYNTDSLDATTIDQVETPNLNQQNVFFAEECERKIIVAHSAPKILFSGSNNASGFSSNADEILVATKEMYRRNINPLRKVVIDGLTKLFKLIDVNVVLEFQDFEEFKEVEEVAKESFDSEIANAQAQATLRGSVGGVTSILEIQSAYVAGTTSYGSAIAMLRYIFGFDEKKSKELLGTPKEDATIQQNPII
jgi:hypothetical protein